MFKLSWAIETDKVTFSGNQHEDFEDYHIVLPVVFNFFEKVRLLSRFAWNGLNIYIPIVLDLLFNVNIYVWCDEDWYVLRMLFFDSVLEGIKTESIKEEKRDAKTEKNTEILIDKLASELLEEINGRVRKFKSIDFVRVMKFHVVLHIVHVHRA